MKKREFIQQYVLSVASTNGFCIIPNIIMNALNLADKVEEVAPFDDSYPDIIEKKIEELYGTQA